MIPPLKHRRPRALYRHLLLSLVALILCSVVWDIGELWILETGSKLYRVLTGEPFQQRRVVDQAGIPMQDYRGLGKQYNPLFIARDAQEAWHRGGVSGQRDFRRYSDWLADNSVAVDSTLILPYRFDYPEYGLKAPWTSALAQAVTMNVLYDRYRLEGDSLWAKRSNMMIRSLDPANGSGLAIKTPAGIRFLEYPNAEGTWVLNGMMSVLLELHEYAIVSGNSRAVELFDAGKAELISSLKQFDRNGYSLYDSGGKPAGRMYHRKHIGQLRALAEISPDPTLLHYAKRWQKHDHLPLPWQLLHYAPPQRVLAFVLSWVMLIILLEGIMLVAKRHGKRV